MKLITKQGAPRASSASRFIKITALLLAVAAVFLSAGCVNDGETQPVDVGKAEPEGSITLGFSADDSLNPYYVKTQVNNQLTMLVFEPLFRVDETLTAVPAVAESCTVEGLTATVVLSKSACFSDGTDMTSADVIYSFQCAKESALYSALVANFTSAVAAGEDGVAFVMETSDPYAAGMLGFPIVKNGTAVDENSIPVGTGRYVYVKDESGSRLSYNAKYTAGNVSVGQIELYSLDSSVKLSYNLQMGYIDVCCEELGSDKVSRVNANSFNIKQNNLIYLGLNSATYSLSFSKVRQAISAAVNRQELADSVWQGMARPAYTPFNPDWKVFAASEVDTSSFALDLNRSIDLLEQQEFTDILDSGARSGTHGVLSFSLLVNSDNEYKKDAAYCIADSLMKAGIYVVVNEKPFEEYKTALSEGGYDMYIGEVKMPANGRLDAFFSDNGGASFGIYSQSLAWEAYDEYIAGTLSLEAYVVEFLNDFPFVPLCYRNDLLICSPDIEVSESFCINDIFSGIGEWTLPDEGSTVAVEAFSE